MSNPILIATRKSPLALKQTEKVRQWLEEKLHGERYEELQLTTQVDERLSWSLEKRGDIGLFTKELEEALLADKATLAVHSAKDMPTTFQKDLCIAGYLPRARANDILVHRSKVKDPKLIATSSYRRRMQFALINQSADWITLRGNIGTRLRQIAKDKKADATLLAAAGLDRLGIDRYEGLKFVELSIEKIVPAPGQAAIAIQCRERDLIKYRDLFCEKTKLAVTLEREFLHHFGGGCQTPLGAHYDGEIFHIYHPKVGHTTYKFVLTDILEIDGLLSTILNDLNL